jgi:hypothetical protein
MKNTHHWQWAATLCSAVALCGTLAAQAPSPSTPPPSTPPSSSPQSSQPTPAPQGTPAPESTQPTGRSSSEMAGQVTATGCLQRDSASSTASSPSSSAGAGGGFLLKNAKMGGASPSSAGASSTEPTSRAPGSMSGASGAKDINLMADASVNLSEHVGHQVMVTGRMAPAAAPAESAAPSSPGASKGGSFTVTKVSMISATCSTGS